jgi:hypothetical protein
LSSLSIPSSQVGNTFSAISAEMGFISKTNLSDGDQFNIEVQLTIPMTSGKELLNISFVPTRKVSETQI